MGEALSAMEYLAACSKMSLESFLISRTSRLASLRRQMRTLVDQWMEAEVGVELAGCVLEHRSISAMFSKLCLRSPVQTKSFEKAVISFWPVLIEISAAAKHREGLTTFANFLDAGAYRLLEDGTAIFHVCKNAARGHPSKMRKPYVRPLVRACVASFSERPRAVVMSIVSSPKAQHQLAFEFRGPLVAAF